jgi:serine/threonine protein kinase
VVPELETVGTIPRLRLFQKDSRAMVTNDLGACEWFVWDLRRSGLIDRGQLDQLVGDFLKRNPRAEAPALAEYLVHGQALTGFQAERILNGKTQGLVLGPYILQDAIGQGSMGQVYRATSKNDTTTYAVKVLPRRSMWNVRLARRQVRSFSQFQHPAVLPFVDVGTAGGLHYLVWPFAEGQSLESLIAREGRLTVAQTALIGLQIAQGLAIAHQNSLFHGLIKPSNIMIGADGQSRILDFGIGSLLVENEGESLVDTMSTANTLTSGLDCASPESILEPTNRTPAGDQYSLGCVLYTCLTGQVPFPEGSAVEKMMAHQTKEPQPVHDFHPEVPEAVVEVVHRLMAKKPEDRFAGLDEVVEALEPFVGEVANVAVETPPAVAASARTMPGSRNRLPGLTTVGGGGSNNGSKPLPGRVASPVQTPPPAAAAFAAPAARPLAASTSGFAPAATPPRPTRSAIPAPQPVPAARQSFGGAGRSLPNPIPQRGSPAFPSRASFNGPPMEAGEVPLIQALADPPPFADPNRQSMPGGWIPPDEEPDSGGAFGTLGLILAAMLLASLVFLGATVMMK